MNGLINKNTIMEAWVFLRKKNHSIPNETLDFMRDVSLRELEKIESEQSKGGSCEPETI